MLPSNMLLLNLILLIDVTFSTPTPHYAHHGVNECLITLRVQNHPRQSPTTHSICSYFPVFSSPTATIEVVGNTGKTSSEKAGVGGSTLSLVTIAASVSSCAARRSSLMLWA